MMPRLKEVYIKEILPNLKEKFGFKIHNKEQSSILLKKYWSIPSKQIENSVVLEKY